VVVVNLFPFQVGGVKDVYAALRQHNSVMFQLPTGGGKTHCAMAVIKHGLAHNKRILFTVDRLVLADQTIEKFAEHGIRCGVIQGDHPTNLAAPVQVASIQTLRSREFWPECDLHINDEAHVQYDWVTGNLDKQKNIGLSATPFTTGLGLHWDALVVGVTTAQLIEMGYLSAYVAFGPSAPDLTGVKTSMGDYNTKQLEPRVTEIIGKVVDHYEEHAEGRKTLAFAVNVAHAEALAEQFNARGINAGFVSHHDTFDERQTKLALFRRGAIRVMCNVEVLTKGFDLPDVTCLILARPTKSLSLHIQMMGRGLRTAENKENCLILDHAGNIERLGFPDDPLPQVLCTKKKGVSSIDKREKEDPLPWLCSKCKHLNDPEVRECGACGHVRRRPTKVSAKDERLVQLVGGTDKPSKQKAYSMLLEIAAIRGYSTGWVAHKYKALFGVWPRGLHPTRETPSPKIESWVKSQQIRWAKSRENRA
jgi:superfamily II DNA or RNA helicase